MLLQKILLKIQVFKKKSLGYLWSECLKQKTTNLQKNLENLLLCLHGKVTKRSF